MLDLEKQVEYDPSIAWRDNWDKWMKETGWEEGYVYQYDGNTGKYHLVKSIEIKQKEGE